MKLISITDFVLQEHNKFCDFPYKELEKEYNYALTLIAKFRNYAEFLKQKLSLEMFVPCKLVEGVWVVLKKPDADYYMNVTEKDLKEFQEAKDRVLFEGFNIDKELPNLIMHKSGWSLSKRDLHRCTVETYANNGYNLKLTTTAQKLIGL